MAVTRKPSCPSGHVLRESYRSASGKLVRARCIRKTGVFRGKASEKMEQMRNNTLLKAKMASHMSRRAGLPTPSKCPKGLTLRAGYTRRSYDRKTGKHVHRGLVPPVCIKTRGKKTGKEKVIIFLKTDHLLSQHGYYNVMEKTQEERHRALHSVIKDLEKEHGLMPAWNYVIKALNARYLVNRNTNPKIARIMKADQRQISKEYKQAKQPMKSVA